MTNHNNFKPQLVSALEISRYVLISLGLYLAYNGSAPKTSFDYLLLLVVIPLAGLTGIESLWLPEATAKAKDRELGSAYQTQSGLNNLAIALTAMLVWYKDWGIKASMTTLIVMLVFLILSSINHTVEYINSKNKILIHLLRPILTTLLVVACLPFIIKQW